MSDEEIRDLLGLGVQDPLAGDTPTAQQLWEAGRRQRNHSRAWAGGLGAVAAAAGIVGIVWAQGLGGEAAPLPADTIPGPTVEADSGARGEPFLAQFEQRGNEPPFQLTGAAVPAALESLQGTWDGPFSETFTFDGAQLTVRLSECTTTHGTVQITADGELRQEGEWSEVITDLDCPLEREMTPWRAALGAQPLLSLDGDTLLVSGLDGTTDEPRVPVALTLGAVNEAGLAWQDGTPRTGVPPITLGGDFQLLFSGGGDGSTFDSIHELTLEEHPGSMAYAGTCPQEMQTSLRADGVLLAGAPAPFVACAEGSDAPLPPAEPSPAVIALLRSGPTVGFDGDTMVISGTIPEWLLPQAPPVSDPPPSVTDDTEQTSEPTEGVEPPSSDGTQVVGAPTLIVMSEGDWAPTGELTPLTAQAATGRHWRPVATSGDTPVVAKDLGIGGLGLSFNGSTWRIRDCGVDITAPGTIQNGRLVVTGDLAVVPDPDPDTGCAPGEPWEQILTSRPLLSTDGSLLTISASTGDSQREPVGMAMLAEGVDSPRGGPQTAVTVEDLAAGLTEVPGQVAAADVGVTDVRDPQPDRATTLAVEDGFVMVDVGCAEPLRGAAWFSQVGPEADTWQLSGALPRVRPEATNCTADAAKDAELWRQMLAQGIFLIHFGDYVIVDSWAEPPGP